jgi:hypothetical protein
MVVSEAIADVLDSGTEQYVDTARSIPMIIYSKVSNARIIIWSCVRDCGLKECGLFLGGGTENEGTGIHQMARQI